MKIRMPVLCLPLITLTVVFCIIDESMPTMYPYEMYPYENSRVIEMVNRNTTVLLSCLLLHEGTNYDKNCRWKYRNSRFQEWTQSQVKEQNIVVDGATRMFYRCSAEAVIGNMTRRHTSLVSYLVLPALPECNSTVAPTICPSDSRVWLFVSTTIAEFFIICIVLCLHLSNKSRFRMIRKKKVRYVNETMSISTEIENSTSHLKLRRKIKNTDSTDEDGYIIPINCALQANKQQGANSGEEAYERPATTDSYYMEVEADESRYEAPPNPVIPLYENVHSLRGN